MGPGKGPTVVGLAELTSGQPGRGEALLPKHGQVRNGQDVGTYRGR